MSQIKKTEVSWESKDVLETIPITSKLNCYRLTRYVNGDVVSVSEGFTSDDTPKANKGIQNQSTIMFFKDDVLKFNLETPYGFYSADYDVQKSFIIDKPFTFLLSCKDFDYAANHVVILDYKSLEGRLMDLDGNYIPQCIVFNDINSIDNEDYDLEAMLPYLKNHPKVKILEPEIMSIPWYNATEDRNQYIKFMYIPTAQEFNDMVKSKRDLHYAAVELLELNQFKKVETDGED